MQGLLPVLSAVRLVAMLTACSSGDNDYNPGVNRGFAGDTPDVSSVADVASLYKQDAMGAYTHDGRSDNAGLYC